MAMIAPAVKPVAMRGTAHASTLSTHARLLYRTLVQTGPLSPARVAAAVAESGQTALDQLRQLGLARETSGVWWRCHAPR